MNREMALAKSKTRQLYRFTGNYMLSLIVEMSTRLLILCSLKASYTKDFVVESLKSLPVAFLLPEDLRNTFCQWRSKISYENCYNRLPVFRIVFSICW